MSRWKNVFQKRFSEADTVWVGDRCFRIQCPDKTPSFVPLMQKSAQLQKLNLKKSFWWRMIQTESELNHFECGWHRKKTPKVQETEKSLSLKRQLKNSNMFGEETGKSYFNLCGYHCMLLTGTRKRNTMLGCRDWVTRAEPCAMFLGSFRLITETVKLHFLSVLRHWRHWYTNCWSDGKIQSWAEWNKPG